MKRLTVCVFIGFSFLLFGQVLGRSAPFDQAPSWAREAIWYQIFVERFRNGDLSNDPSPVYMEGAYPGFVPDNWEITPWQHDWYEQESWAKAEGDNFHKLAAARRFGGDLQGVLEKLDYLQDLGITAIYFNPLNDSPSLHKYDVRHYRHIDRNFGPDPAGDSAIIDEETPIDPSSWQWTAADKLFLKLIDEVHRRRMRLIMDYSWNHTGIKFWAWEDLKKNQAKSRYKDWYDIISFDDPKTPEDEFRYEGWLGVKTLPELKKINVSNKKKGLVFEGDLHPEVKTHIFNVTRRWLDPNGDGDPSDGVDGFRLDVASHVPLGFWRNYRKFVRGINKEALLLGEAWWTNWPDELMDPRPFLKGDIFDSVMHYQWYKPARMLFARANGGLKPSAFVAEMNRVYKGYSKSISQNLMNLVASHDSPRFSTSFQNKNKYKYRMGARGNMNLHLGPPDLGVTHEMRMMLLHQFTYTSAPHIWNGDELGMWGADDPDCRKPIIWDDIAHRPQVFNPIGERSKPIQVRPDSELNSYYKKLISLRKKRLDWKFGSIDYVLADDSELTMAYYRANENHRSIVAFNFGDRATTLSLKKGAIKEVGLLAESRSGALTSTRLESGILHIELSSSSGVALSID